MQGHELAYSADEKTIILGGPLGLLEVYAVKPDDGSPGERHSSVLFHKEDLCFVGFSDRGEVVSVSIDGAFAVSDPCSGQVLRSGTAVGEYAHASLSPSGTALFVFTYQSTARVFRVDVATGAVQEGPNVEDVLGVTSRVFALDDTSAAFHFLGEDENDRVEEGLAFVDFEAGTVSRRAFTGAPPDTFAMKPLVLDVDPLARVGLRYDWSPVQKTERGGAKFWVCSLQLFTLDTLRPVRTLMTSGYREDDEELEALGSESPDSEAYRDAQEKLLERVSAVRIVRGLPRAWVCLSGGGVRSVDLSSGMLSPVIVHGGEAKQGAPTLNTIFERSLVNNVTLAVSPSGDLVAFANPNDFFNVRKLDLSGPGMVNLPTRALASGTREQPDFAQFTADGRALVVTRVDTVFLLDPKDGRVMHRLELPEDSGEVTSASLSADGTRLLLSMSGGEPLLAYLDREGGEGLGVPPHTLMATFDEDGGAFFVHSHGAVVHVDLDEGQMTAFRAEDDDHEGDDDDSDDESDDDSDDESDDDSDDDNDTIEDNEEEDDPEDGDEDEGPSDEDEGFDDEDDELDYAAFEQRYDCYAGVHWVKDGQHFLATGDENDAVQIYRWDSGSFVAAGAFSADGGVRRLACDGQVLAALGKRTLELMRVTDGKTLHEIKFGQPLCLVLGGRSGEFLVFDREKSALIALHPKSGAQRELFQHRGNVVGAHVNEQANRAFLQEASGELVLVDALTGAAVARLSLGADANGERTLKAA